MTSYNTTPIPTKAHFSLPSLLAIAAAVGSFFAGGGMGMLLAVAAIVLGLIGLLLAFGPTVRGGLVSIVSIVAGLLGILVAIFRFIF
jgi:hypothetical protein